MSPAATSNPTPGPGEPPFARATLALSKTSGFIAEAGFTHSLTPARNCTYGCLYCYVPTLRIHGGLRPEDWRRWGQFATFKSNLPELLRKQLRPDQRIYCSPLTDPYQPAEKDAQVMPSVLRELIASPPRVFALQTRGPLVLRDLNLLRELHEGTRLRISFSITTNRDSVRKLFEPHCEPINERLAVMRELCAAGLEVHATLAPLLPCDPDALVDLAAEASNAPLIVDPLHVRAAKKRGATTREAAHKLVAAKGLEQWMEPASQQEVIDQVRRRAQDLGRACGVGAEGFACLACD